MFHAGGCVSAFVSRPGYHIIVVLAGNRVDNPFLYDCSIRFNPEAGTIRKDLKKVQVK